MDDVADVGFVDAHAEGDGGADDFRLVAEEGVLVFRAFRGLEAGVIGDGGKSLGAEGGGEGLGVFPRLAIDDAGVLAAALGEIADLGGSAGFGGDLVFEIRPVEAGEETRGVAQLQLDDDVLAHPLGRGGGERQHRDVRDELADLLQAAVFRAEIMPPLADAVRLVHREGGDPPTDETRQEIGQHQPLGRDVEKLVGPGIKPVDAAAGFISIERGVEKRGRHAAGFELVHLVLHQGDERRDDDRETTADQGG